MDSNTTTPKSRNDTELVVDSKVYIISVLFHLVASVASNLLVMISVIKFRYLRETAHTLVTLLACFFILESE